jgi:CSLREA domain-containing protein
MHSNAEKRAILTVLSTLVLALMLALAVEPAGASTTFIVTETGDAGDADITDGRCDVDLDTTGKQCTLRAAIEEANHTSGVNIIHFDIGGSGSSKTISPDSALPAITDEVTIDGYTQPGASPNTIEEGDDAVLNVQLDGLNAGFGATGLLIEASDCTIQGLVIKRFEYDGIQVLGTGATGNRIEGNFIGVSRDGTTDRGNGYLGVEVEGDSNTVGGTDPASRNVISGNEWTGVVADGAENFVEGNYVGTKADGIGDLGNSGDGVSVYGDSNTVGGTTPGTRNVISGNVGVGVFVFGSETTDNLIEGNYVGTEADGQYLRRRDHPRRGAVDRCRGDHRRGGQPDRPQRRRRGRRRGLCLRWHHDGHLRALQPHLRQRRARHRSRGRYRERQRRHRQRRGRR